MARKKERIMAFKTLQPDTLHSPTERVCRNFICFEKNVKDCLCNEDMKDAWKHDVAIQREFDTLVGYQTELRGGLGCIGMDLVSLLPVTLEKTVKTTTPYIYSMLDYSQARASEVFCTRKEVLQYIQKKIKTKNVVMHYNGITERGELDTEHIDEIFDGLESDTIDFDILPLGRGDVEGDIILVTVYKNCMKI